MDPEDEIITLVRTLHETQQRLQVLAAGEVDAVVHPGGHSYLLHEAQEKLRQNEATQRDFAASQSSVLNALPAQIALLDSEGVIISVNDKWEEFARGAGSLNSVTLVGQNYLGVCDRARGRGAEEAHQAADGIRGILSGSATEFLLEYPCHSPTSQRWFSLQVNPMRKDGPGGAVVMHVDITERKLAEQAARASANSLALAQQIAHCGSWELDLGNLDHLDANALRWSDEMFRIAGYEPSSVEISNEFFFNLVPRDEHEAIRQAITSAIRDRRPYSIIHRLRRPDGEERIVHERGQVSFHEETGQATKLLGTAQDITKRRVAEENLEANAVLLREFIQHAPAAIAMLDTQMRYLEASERWIADYHLDGQAMIGRSHYEIFPDVPQRWKEIHQRVLAGAVERCEEDAFPRADGTTDWLQWEARPWHEGGGRIGGLIFFTQVITERKRMELALQQSETRHRLLFENMLEGYAYCQILYEEGQARDYIYLEVNSAFEPQTGLKNVTGKKVSEVVPDMHTANPEQLEIYARVSMTGEPEQFESHAKALGIWFSVSVYSHEKGHFIAVFDNITKRKQAEETLQRQQTELKVLFDLVPAMIWFKDTKNCFLRVNQRVAESTGMRVEEIEGKSAYEIFPAQAAGYYADDLKVIESGAPQMGIVEKLRGPEGQELWVQTDKVPVCDQNGNVTGLIALVQDITERQRASAQLVESRQRLALATESARLGIWEWDIVTNKLVWDAQMYALYGIREEDFSGAYEAWQSGVHPDDRQRSEAELMVAVDGVNGFHTEFRVEWPSGEVRDIEAHAVMQHTDDGSPRRMIGVNFDITERKRTERAMRESESHFRFLNDLGEVTRTLSNPAQIMAEMCRMLGEHLRASHCAYGDVEKDGTHFNILHDYSDGGASLVGDYDLALFGKRVLTTLQSGKTVIIRDVKTELLPEDGADSFSALGVQAVICCPLLKAGRLGAKMAVYQTMPRDWQSTEVALVEEVVERCWAMMERRMAEESLRKSDALLRIASQSARLGGWEVEIPATRVSWSDEVCAIHGMPPGSTPGVEEAINFYAPDSRQKITEVFTACAEVGTPFDVELEIINAQGSSVCVRSIGEAQRNAAGVITRVHGAFQDITERKRAEEEVRLNEQRYRLLVEATTAIVWDAPASGEFESEQSSWSAFTGQTFKELKGIGWLNAVHPEDQAETARVWTAACNSRSNYRVEHRLLARDKSYHNMLVRAVPILDDDGAIRQWIGVHTDITDMKLAQTQIAEQAKLIDETRDAIVVRDLEDRITFWNKGAERLFGWTSEEVQQDLLRELLQTDENIYGEGGRAVRETGEWNGELQKTGRDGSVRTLDCRWTLLRDPLGTPRSILSIDTDITERKKIENQFLRAQRMESIGTLAGGIAHDLNNALGPVIMSVELLSMRFPDPDSQHLISIIGSSAQRGADMVRQVLSFARGVEGERVETDIKHLIQDIERIARDTFLKHITVRTIIHNELRTVMGDPTQIHQVLLNLCVNARDAMPDGGVLIISADNRMIDEQYAGLNLDAKPGSYVVIEVEDTGSGMPPAVIEKIFEPFFTTKELGKGTGLGLSTSIAIVKSHGGFVRVYSEPGKGTKFQVYLPANTESSGETRSESAPEMPLGNGELILVVDDEGSVRQITQQTLQAFGYRVVLACDGAEAVAVFAQRRAEIAVVLTDMMMPVMDGAATIHALSKMCPGLPIIAASGLSENRTAAAARLGVKHFLPKPYTAPALLQILQQILSPNKGDAPRL